MSPQNHVPTETANKSMSVSSPEMETGKISSRPFQYLSTVQTKIPGSIVTIKGKDENAGNSP